jgi:EAL and modified HD-GYP domain-containing signal transduction protein
MRTINSLGPDRIAQFREIWLTLGEGSLSSPLLHGLPARSTVVLVRSAGNHAVSGETLDAARALKEQGFRLGFAGFADSIQMQTWMPLLDCLALDVPAFAPNELGEEVGRLRGKHGALRIVARRIDSYEEFEYCHRNGFDAFSGKFLTNRENWPPQPPLSPDRVRLCELLNELRAGAELTDIAERLRVSPEIAYRFLRFINSAGMGLATRIASIEQGALFIGREKLYRWLTLLLFSAPEGRLTDSALLEQALVRGRMMELMGADKLSHLQCDELFVAGVFSLFDVLLRMPLVMALRPLQLPPPVEQALLENAGIYAPYVRAAVAFEADGDQATAPIEALAAAVDLPPERVSAHHLEAVAWAQQLTPST